MNCALRGAIGIDQVRQQLNHATTELDHESWPDDVSLLDDKRIDFSKIFSHNHISDVYLLAMAVAHRRTLVTFDQHIALTAVKGAADKHLVVFAVIAYIPEQSHSFVWGEKQTWYAPYYAQTRLHAGFNQDIAF